MDELKYREAMAIAKLMGDVEPDCAEYWLGYRRGIVQQQYGSKYWSRGEHEWWMNCARGGDREQLQAGYRKGYSSGGT